MGQTLIYGVSSVLGRMLNVLLTPILTRAFSRAVFGIYTSLYAWVAFINVVLTFGMETTFFRFIQDHEDEEDLYSQAFVWVSILASLFLLLCLIFHQEIAAALGYPEYGLAVMYMGGFIFLDAVAALPLARLRYREKAMRFAVINLVNIGVNLSANIVFIVLLEKGITYVFLANLIASGIRTTLALWGNLPKRLKPAPAVLRPMLRYAVFIMVAGLAGIANEVFDRLAIPYLWEDGRVFRGVARSGEEMNGLYGANYKVAMLVALFTQAYRYAVEPFFFKTAKDKNSPETYARIFHFFSLATLFGFLLLSSFTHELMATRFSLPWLGTYTFIDEKFWEALDIVPVLLLAYVFSAAYINISIWFKITKQTRFALVFTGTGAFITILGNVWGIPLYGYVASAWATLACYTVMSLMVYFLGQKYYPVPYRVGRLLVYLLLCILVVGFNQGIGPSQGFSPAIWTKIVACFAAGLLIGTWEFFVPSFGRSAQR